MDQLLKSKAIKLKNIIGEFTANKENKQFLTGRIQAIKSTIRNRKKSIKCGFKTVQWKFVNLNWMPKYAWKQCNHRYLEGKIFCLHSRYYDKAIDQHLFPEENVYCYCYYKLCID